MNALTKINPKTKMLTANGVGVVAGPALTVASYHGMKAGFGQE
jgi:hypothetical protein